jgi:hypothetical protein
MDVVDGVTKAEHLLEEYELPYKEKVYIYRYMNCLIYTYMYIYIIYIILCTI